MYKKFLMLLIMILLVTPGVYASSKVDENQPTENEVIEDQEKLDNMNNSVEYFEKKLPIPDVVVDDSISASEVTDSFADEIGRIFRKVVDFFLTNSIYVAIVISLVSLYAYALFGLLKVKAKQKVALKFVIVPPTAYIVYSYLLPYISGLRT